jgi:hypothetical protein
VTAVFHDKSALVKAPNVGQRFVQNLGFTDELVHCGANANCERHWLQLFWGEARKTRSSGAEGRGARVKGA